MAITRWDPFAQFSMLRNMDRIFDEAFGAPRRYLGEGLGQYSLPIDMYETAAELIVKAHIPGVDPDQVSITVEKGVLSISAHLASAAEKEDAKDYRWYHRETWFGDVTRSVSLPSTVDTERAHASFHNGVLTLTLPKAETAKPRQIPVTVDGAKQLQ